MASFALIVLFEDSRSSFYIGRIKVVSLFPYPMSNDKPPTWSVVTQETKLKTLEFPEPSARFPEALEVLATGYFAMIRQTLEEDDHLLTIRPFKGLKILKRRHSAPAVDRPLHRESLSSGGEGLIRRHDRVYL